MLAFNAPYLRPVLRYTYTIQLTGWRLDSVADEIAAANAMLNAALDFSLH